MSEKLSFLMWNGVSNWEVFCLVFQFILLTLTIVEAGWTHLKMLTVNGEDWKWNLLSFCQPLGDRNRGWFANDSSMLAEPLLPKNSLHKLRMARYQVLITITYTYLCFHTRAVNQNSQSSRYNEAGTKTAASNNVVDTIALEHEANVWKNSRLKLNTLCYRPVELSNKWW